MALKIESELQSTSSSVELELELADWLIYRNRMIRGDSDFSKKKSVLCLRIKNILKMIFENYIKTKN